MAQRANVSGWRFQTESLTFSAPNGATEIFLPGSRHLHSKIKVESVKNANGNRQSIETGFAWGEEICGINEGRYFMWASVTVRWDPLVRGVTECFKTP